MLGFGGFYDKGNYWTVGRFGEQQRISPTLRQEHATVGSGSTCRSAIIRIFQVVSIPRARAQAVVD